MQEALKDEEEEQLTIDRRTCIYNICMGVVGLHACERSIIIYEVSRRHAATQEGKGENALAGPA